MSFRDPDATSVMKALTLMHTIRYFEEEMANAYSLGLIGGFCHLCTGQEAVYAGLKYLMKKEDYSVTSYRSHGVMIAVGSELEPIAAELFGRYGGCSKGKGGSMHTFDQELGFFGGNGIVGAQTSLGAGLAFSKRYKCEEGVAFSFLGDGAVNQGQFYEALNMAALWGLPVVYIIENNKYAMGTSTVRSSCTEDLFVRAKGFGIDCKAVDGMDFFSVVRDSAELIEKARTSSVPVVIEMKTYRYRGHSMSDPAKYRSKEEVKCFRVERDPILNLGKYIVDNKIATEQELIDIENGIENMVKNIVQKVESSGIPPNEELFTDVLVP